jgi:hypothetical protein
MKSFEVVAAFANVNSGRIALSRTQYEARRHNLEPAGDGIYKVRSPIQFKRGEIFGYDGEVNKALLQHLEPTDKPTDKPRKPKNRDGNE